MTIEERNKAIRILQWLHDNNFLFASTEEDVKYATKLAIQELLQEPKAEKVIKMRDATPEERESIDKYIKSISKPTGVNFGDLEQEPCKDCISRQAVEEMIKAEMPERGMWEIEGDKEKETVCEVCVDLMQKLSELQPITPQTKTGHWIIIDDCEQFIAKCSECGRIEDSRMINKYPYCHCGAKMQAKSDIKQGLNYADEDTLMPAT